MFNRESGKENTVIICLSDALFFFISNQKLEVCIIHKNYLITFF